MTTSSLIAASLVALLSGPSGSDQQAYAIYQANLARLLASESGGDVGSTPLCKVCHSFD